MRRIIRRLSTACCLSAIVALAGSAQAQTLTDTATFTFVVGEDTPAGLPANEWFEEHGDIGLGVEGGELELHYHFEDGFNGTGPLDVEFEPDEAFIRVSNNSMLTPGQALQFLGTGANDSIWVLPQGNSGPTGADALGLPFVGIATEELDPLTFATASYELTDFAGPTDGEFALWQDGLTPNVFMQTVDGISSADTLDFGIGVHDHFNFGFTQPGVYAVEFTATVTAVPEPSSFALLASFGAVGTMVRRRRRRD